MNPVMKQRWLSTGEAGQILGVTSETVRRMCNAGRIIGAKRLFDSPQGRWRIPADSPTLNPERAIREQSRPRPKRSNAAAFMDSLYVNGPRKRKAVVA